MIATILRQAPADRRASIAAWRQLSDILAQRGNQLSDDDIRRSLRALAVLRPHVPESVRRDCARAIARHGRFAPLVALYANDVAPVSAAILQTVQLSEADWLAMLPATSATARSLLAGRRDLPQAVYRGLASLGSASVALRNRTSKSWTGSKSKRRLSPKRKQPDQRTRPPDRQIPVDPRATGANGGKPQATLRVCV